MKLAILDKTGKKIADFELNLSQDIREDIFKKAVKAETSMFRQNYGATPLAGKTVSINVTKRRQAHRSTYGKGGSRTPKKAMWKRGQQLRFVGAFAPNTVGGRRAHPPKASKKLIKNINNKETMKTKILILLSLLVMFNITSCKKELKTIDPPIDDNKKMEDLDVPEYFDYSTTQTIQLKVTASDYVGLPATKIEIYNTNPNEGGTIIKSGITDRDQVLEVSFEIPANQEELHIRRTTYLGEIETATIDIDGEDLEYTFTTNKSKSDFKNGVTGPGCTDCTVTIADNQSGILTINTGETYCVVSGGTFTGGLVMNGGT